MRVIHNILSAKPLKHWNGNTFKDNIVKRFQTRAGNILQVTQKKRAAQVRRDLNYRPRVFTK